jgi:hypothetical protein
VNEAQRAARCRRCRHSYPADDLDPHGWCARCKARLIGQGTWIGRVTGALVAFGLGAAIAVYVQPTRFLAGWIALLAGCYLVAMKVTRRVYVELQLTRRRNPASDP